MRPGRCATSRAAFEAGPPGDGPLFADEGNYFETPRSAMWTSSRWLTRAPQIPSVFSADLGWLLTTVPLTTKSILSAPTRTSRALVDLPEASGFFTASFTALATL